MDNVEGVTTETPPISDRPVENVKREFDRKFGDLSAKIDALTGYLAQQEAARVQPPPAIPSKGSLGTASDDELWELAKSGNKEAFDAHQERKAAKVYQTMRSAESEDQLTQGQMAIIAQKYPVLRDPNHQLTQTANQAYTLLVKRGRPANTQTLLDATKTAIADRPDLVAEMQTQGARAREGARRVSAGNTGVMGATHRQEEPANGVERVRVNVEQAALAKRMNIKDPAGAIARFHERQKNGSSKLGLVGAHLDEGDL